jgi:hypothetical protein
LCQEQQTTAFFANELLIAKQIANYFGIKARRMREQQPECFDEPNAAACSTVDGQHTTSEGEEERENAEDPMFIHVEDELIEIVQQLGIIEEQSPSPTIDATPITLTTILTEHPHPSDVVCWPSTVEQAAALGSSKHSGCCSRIRLAS